MTKAAKIIIAITGILTAVLIFYKPTIDLNNFRGAGYNISEPFAYEDGKCIGKIDMPWNALLDRSIYTVKNDKNYNFLVVPDLHDYYIKEGVEIPTSGTVTAVFGDIGGVVTYKQSDIDMFIRIASVSGNEYTFTTDNFGRCGRSFDFAYNNCPVAVDGKGYVVFADNKWLFLSRENYFGKGNKPNYIHSGTFTGFEIKDKDMIEFIEKNPIYICPASYESSESQ
jgi:hypothetical protein